jgi:hypothetical protein
MLKREENHVFAAPVEAVVARWTDADFLTGMMQDQGSREISVTVEHLSSDQIQVAITRQVPVDAPAMIRAVIGSWLDLTPARCLDASRRWQLERSPRCQAQGIVGGRPVPAHAYWQC